MEGFPNMHDLDHTIPELVRLSYPARACWCLISLLILIGCDTMIEYLPQEYFVAVLMTAIFVGAIFLIIMYLCQYEDWKAATLNGYIDRLNSIGASAMDDRPDIAFSKVYIVSLGVSLILSTTASVFIAPIVVDLVCSVVSMTAYVVITAVVAVVLAIFLDGELAHAIADKSFKAKYNRAQELVVSKLEDVFRADAEAAAPSAVMTDELLAKIADMVRQKI